MTKNKLFNILRNGGNGSTREAVRLIKNLVLHENVCLRNYESHA